MSTDLAIHKRGTLSQSWERSKRWPLGNRIFSLMLGRMARYSGSIGATVLELETGRAVVELRDRPRVRNHLRSIHAIALMNLGELVTGVCVMYQVDGRGRGIVRHLEMDYLKKARGTITATCTTQVPLTPGDHDFEARGELRNSEGELVATVCAHWALQVQG